MADPKGFMTIDRKNAGYRPAHERIQDYSEVEQTLNEKDRRDQAARCMDCGVPFCQWGCPVMNNMPEWQDAIYRGDWKEAIEILHVTNNFPEFTGRICPAPCEHACTLNIHKTPVTIRENECSAAEHGFTMGYIIPQPPKIKTGKKVAVIGSGPAGMACADLLNKWGHTVTLYEKDEAVGGLLRYGIPDFKLNKNVIDRRVNILTQEGLNIKTNCHVGYDVKGDQLLKENDAVVLAIGAMQPRDLQVEGRELKGVHFAMEFLTQQNRVTAGVNFSGKDRISAKGKNVLVIGGGDTGSDCVGTSMRHGAKSVRQIEILPKPPQEREANNPWPYWANTLRTSSSHEEGCEREWNLNTKRLISDKDGNVKGVEVVEVDWISNNGKFSMVEKPGSKRIINAGLVLLSMGFVHCVHEGLAKELNLKFDQKGNILIDKNNKTVADKVFATGDAVSGASLVVRAIMAGRKAANSVHEFIMK
ncbi:MAG: glutamate synthase subunit beta [Bacteroidales bacterium]|nr:glutamate synthase subunit beta [Bacteroidales bacterium]